MEFNKDYTNYWAATIQKSIDGTHIAGPTEVRHFLEKLKLFHSTKLLDVGCSFGRMNHLLQYYATEIYGIDLDNYALAKARKLPYTDVRNGGAEKTGYPSKTFESIFCWAVFDVVKHREGLLEFNRILKLNGEVLITGKSDDYCQDDLLAFKAEKNAFIKGFPNKFTNLCNLIISIPKLGFVLKHLIIFPRRGDMGLLNYKEMNVEVSYKPKELMCYEYLLVLSKVAEPMQKFAHEFLQLDSQFSKTSEVLAQKNGFASSADLFVARGLD